MTKAEIVQRLLDNGDITAAEAVILLSETPVTPTVVHPAWWLQ